MNAYKYTAFLDEKDRPLTVFEYFKNPRPGSEQEAFNRNLDVIKQHLESLGDKFQEGRDYIFGTLQDVTKYKASVSEERRKHYQQYDGVMAKPEVRERAHEMFKAKIASEPEIKAYLAKKLPSVDFTAAHHTRESRLIVVNINKRAHQEEWNPREYRHTTPDDAVMRGMIDEVYNAQNSIGGKDKLDISFVGSAFNEQEQKVWSDYAKSKGVNAHFFNDMVGEGLDRNQQRAAMFALTDRYKATTYLGHQSGVNEDAQILPRTNVYSLSEYLGQGQVGISRVEARPQLDTVKTSDLGMATGASSMGNFYSLRNSELLTTKGILAAIQIKVNLTAKHSSLEDLMSKLDRKNNPDMTDAQAIDKLFNMILTDAGKMNDGKPSINLSDEVRDDYKRAIGVIVQREKSKEQGLSAEAKQYFANAMKQELTRHDQQDPVGQHEDKLTSHNAGLRPYTLGRNQIDHRRPTENHDDYLKSVFPPD
ncbi:hypothetical protein SAMN05518865_10865 [Duganella sp. CF458]|nr:hypothetical protein SAMN05518865_10865 [Duganella sp. CF458]